MPPIAGGDTTSLQAVSDSRPADGLYYFDSPGIAPGKVLKLRLRLSDAPFVTEKLSAYVNLVELEADSVPMVKLPMQLKQMTKLQRLKLTHCLINEIPEWISSMENLRELNLSYNAIHALPNELFQLKSLEVLVLEDNKIPELNAKVDGMKKLKAINIKDNFLKTIPQELAKSSHLKTIELWGNCIGQDEMKKLQLIFPASMLLGGVQDPNRCN